MTAAATRDKILDAAETLFFRDGISITGVDRVAQQAGVSVVTLYKHMGSKDGLLVEVLQRRLDMWGQVWQQHVDEVEDPRQKVLAIFDALDAFRVQCQPTQWCTFLATASERAASDDQPETLVRADTEMLLHRLRPLAEAVDPQGATHVMSVIILLYNGALTSLLRTYPGDAAALARDTAIQALGWSDLGERTRRPG